MISFLLGTPWVTCASLNQFTGVRGIKGVDGSSWSVCAPGREGGEAASALSTGAETGKYSPGKVKVLYRNRAWTLGRLKHQMAATFSKHLIPSSGLWW